jgi:hypothetical protein
MLLSIPERILLLDVLPLAEGDFLFLRAVRAFREDLGFSEEEAAEIHLTRQDNTITWDLEKNPMKEIPIGPLVAQYLSRSIKAAPKLHEEHLALYSRFVEAD